MAAQGLGCSHQAIYAPLLPPSQIAINMLNPLAELVCEGVCGCFVSIVGDLFIRPWLDHWFDVACKTWGCRGDPDQNSNLQGRVPTTMEEELQKAEEGGTLKSLLKSDKMHLHSFHFHTL